MKKKQRKPYLGLTTVPLPDHEYPGLCAFCKYAWWYGSCKEAEVRCKHPLKSWERWEPFEVCCGDGADCWGFRPDVDIDEAADMVGIWLQGKAVAAK